jgi:hypothetical protein
MRETVKDEGSVRGVRVFHEGDQIDSLVEAPVLKSSRGRSGHPSCPLMGYLVSQRERRSRLNKKSGVSCDSLPQVLWSISFSRP